VPAVRFVFGLFSGAAVRRACRVGECFTVPPLCVRLLARTMHSVRRASQHRFLAVADGCRVESPVGWPHGHVPPARTGIPAITGTEVSY
jgi:hypothetical protein